MGARLIAFEGVDRSGKSTQCADLVNYLNQTGERAELLKFPDRSTPLGEVINKFLRKEIELTDKAAHLLFSANRWELEQTIRDKLAAGITLVLDRYVFSAQAYGDIGPEDEFWYQQADIGLPAPDLVILLDVPDTSKRGGFGGERYERPEFMARVRQRFLAMARGREDWRVIDASRSIQEVRDEIRATINGE